MASGGTAPGDDNPSHRNQATISDVAKLAGVTKATVSKYLNRAHGYAVSQATRERIEIAIRELGFRPNPLARGLNRGATMTIGLIVANIRNQFYPGLVGSVQSVVEDAGYTLVLGSSGDDADRELDLIREMTHRQVDGVVLASVRTESEGIDLLKRHGIPTVLVSRDLPDLLADTVIVDSTGGARMAIGHLRELGHRRIGHVAGEHTVKPFSDRRIAFEQETADLADGWPLPIVTALSSIKDGRRATIELLERDDRPTAIFYGTDSMALGGYMACAEAGLVIPRDISIAGFDNVEVAQLPGIGLTTVDSAVVAQGESAAAMMLSRIRERRNPNPDLTLTTIPAELIVRSSTGPPTLR